MTEPMQKRGMRDVVIKKERNNGISEKNGIFGPVRNLTEKGMIEKGIGRNAFDMTQKGGEQHGGR